MTDMDCKKIKAMADIGLHEKIIEMMKDERKSIVLDIAAGEGASSCKLYNLGFDVTSWDINKNYKELKIGDILIVKAKNIGGGIVK